MFFERKNTKDYESENCFQSERKEAKATRKFSWVDILGKPDNLSGKTNWTFIQLVEIVL